jgi:hypothetical protein
MAEFQVGLLVYSTGMPAVSIRKELRGAAGWHAKSARSAWRHCKSSGVMASRRGSNCKGQLK